MKTKQSMNQNEFWNLSYIKERQEIQKRNPYGSEAHKRADFEMKEKLAELTSIEFAENYWGDY